MGSGAMADATLGWQIEVEHPGNGATEAGFFRA